MFDEFQVLDTLKFKDGKIFLKKFHFERTLEACRLIKPNLHTESLKQIYDEVESKYADQIHENQIIRLLFKADENLTFKLEIIKKLTLPEILKLQLISTPKQVSGLGKQNYKWNLRVFWVEILKLKSAAADDVICMNEKNEITETSRCNIFLYDAKTDEVFTPFLDSGCINGVYRRHVMQNRKIMLPDHGEKILSEKIIYADDLLNYQIYLANSVREVMRAGII